MNSFTEKRVTWKRVMMSSWTGLTLPRIAPKATQTEPTQKSALMRLWKGVGEELRQQQEAALQALGSNRDWLSVDLGLWLNLSKLQFRHLWQWAHNILELLQEVKEHAKCLAHQGHMLDATPFLCSSHLRPPTL